MGQGKRAKLARAGLVRPGETPEEFSARMAEIEFIEVALMEGHYRGEEAEAAMRRLHQLKGPDFEDEEPPTVH